MEETTPHDAVHAFADGELSAEEAHAFRLHLGTCAQCQGELADILQLQGLSGALAEAQTRAPAPTPAPPSRAFQPVWSRRRRAVLGGVLGGALAAAFAFALLRTPSGPLDAQSLALAPTRSLEARLSYGGASDWRPYGVKRSGGERPAEQVPLKTLAKLEEAGDVHGLATASLLSGEREQAAEYLRRAPPGHPDVESDRAALALARGAPEEALALLDGVLEKHPAHPQALWNRGLVLRELGLELAAAQGFARVAALNERGWSDEARERQRALEAQVAERVRRWKAGEGREAPGTHQFESAPQYGLADALGSAREELARARQRNDAAREVQLLQLIAGMLRVSEDSGLARAHAEEAALRQALLGGSPP